MVTQVPPERYAQTIRELNELWNKAAVWRTAMFFVIMAQAALTSLTIVFLVVYNVSWWYVFEALAVVAIIFIVIFSIRWRRQVRESYTRVYAIYVGKVTDCVSCVDAAS